MEDSDPFPECPPFPPGLTLGEKRRFVSEWGKETEPWRVRQAKVAGIKFMTWSTSGLDDVCENCLAAEDVAVAIEEFDVERHYAACSCPDGCGCICGPAPDDADLDEEW